jgi:hypothetical protein
MLRRAEVMVRKEEKRMVEEMPKEEIAEKKRLKKKLFSYRRCVVEAFVIGEW